MLGKVYISREIADKAVGILEDKCEIVGYWNKESPPPVSRQELLQKISGCEGLLCSHEERVNSELLEAAPKLKVVSTFSVGYDHIDLKECRKRNISVGHTPDVLTDAVAEYTIGLMMCAGRRLFEANQQLKRSIKESTVGIIGFGRIGQSIARKLTGIEPKKILYFDIVDRSKESKELNAEFCLLDDVLRESDFIVPCCNLTDGANNLFNLRTFGLMKKGAYFVNTSRGAVVDHEALHQALEYGHLAGAALDVCTPEPLPTDHKLLKLPNCGAAAIQATLKINNQYDFLSCCRCTHLICLHIRVPINGDPTEHVNLAKKRPRLLNRMKATIMRLRKQIAPSAYKPLDPRGDPKRHNGTMATGWC